MPVLDSGARDATLTFVRKGMGDVLLAWENEALQETSGPEGDKFEVVTPASASSPSRRWRWWTRWSIGWARGRRRRRILKYLYSAEGQKIAAKNFYRPSDAKWSPHEYLKPFAELKLFTVDDVFGGWQKAQKTHFNDGGMFDEILPTPAQDSDGAHACLAHPDGRNRACCRASA